MFKFCCGPRQGHAEDYGEPFPPDWALAEPFPPEAFKRSDIVTESSLDNPNASSNHPLKVKLDRLGAKGSGCCHRLHRCCSRRLLLVFVAIFGLGMCGLALRFFAP